MTQPGQAGIPAVVPAAGMAIGQPVFAAYNNTTSTCTTGLQIAPFTYDTVIKDNFGGFNNTGGNYRYTAKVAGWYYIQAMVSGYFTTTYTQGWIYIRKNGSPLVATLTSVGGTASLNTIQTSAIVFLNGTTDYVDTAVTFGGTGTCNIGFGNNGLYGQFTGIMITQ